MKRFIIYAVVFQLIVVFTGCEKEMMDYEGKEGVYFAVRHGNPTRSAASWPYQPYSDIDFVQIGLDEHETVVTVAITGPVKDYDRPFYIEVNPDSTTAVAGQHYEAVQRDWIIPAGAISTDIKVRVKRTPDLEEAPKTLGLRLVASAELELSFPEWDAIPSLDGGDIVEKFDASLHSLRINDIMIRPAVWSGSLQADNRESGLFGVFTRKKMEFLMEHLGLQYDDFSSAETMPMARMMLIASDGAAILIKRFNEKDPILEDDGRLMWMGSVPWSSYLGVPYVPGP